jgi:hypothetical protein
VKYEHSDASFRWIFTIILGTVVFAGVVEVAILGFFNHFAAYEADIKKSPYPLAPSPATALPREPRLEQLDRVARVETPNVYEREASKLQVLNSYGHTQDKDYVHIPIEQAMKLLENQLPARPEPSAAQRKRSNGLVDAGESNSGRVFKGEPK